MNNRKIYAFLAVLLTILLIVGCFLLTLKETPLPQSSLDWLARNLLVDEAQQAINIMRAEEVFTLTARAEIARKYLDPETLVSNVSEEEIVQQSLAILEQNKNNAGAYTFQDEFKSVETCWDDKKHTALMIITATPASDPFAEIYYLIRVSGDRDGKIASIGYTTASRSPTDTRGGV